MSHGFFSPGIAQDGILPLALNRSTAQGHEHRFFFFCELDFIVCHCTSPCLCDLLRLRSCRIPPTKVCGQLRNRSDCTRSVMNTQTSQVGIKQPYSLREVKAWLF